MLLLNVISSRPAVLNLPDYILKLHAYYYELYNCISATSVAMDVVATIIPEQLHPD